MKNKPTITWGLYLAAAIVCLLAQLTPNPWPEYLSKPLLMPILMVYVWREKQIFAKSKYLLYLALFFAWLGDVLLMFKAEVTLFFVLGLGAFLLMQLLYIYLFSQVPQIFGTRPLLKQRPYLAVPPLALAVAVSAYIVGKPETPPDMQIAVPFYALALSGMVVAAINRYGRVNGPSFWSVVWGASLFLVSDLMIAVNAFIWPGMGWAGLFIMATYIPAQALIIRGIATAEV